MAEHDGEKTRWDFSDIIIGGHGELQSIKNMHPDSDFPNHPEIVKKLWEECLKEAFPDGGYKDDKIYGPVGEPEKRDFSIVFIDEVSNPPRQVRFRVCVLSSTEGVVFCLRRISETIPELTDQGYPKEIITDLLNPDRRGLVLFGGEMGVGKTTGATSFVMTWLRKNGYSAVALEDPAEYGLHGPHSPVEDDDVGGFCIQRPCKSENMPSEMAVVMRASAPEIIFVGEIRDAMTALAVLLAASNGQLIVSTIHGNGIPGCINRLVSLVASLGTMKTDEVMKLLGDSLSMIMTQELIRPGKDDEDGRKMLRVSWIDFMPASDNASDPSYGLRTLVRENNIPKIRDAIRGPRSNPSRI